MADIWILAAVTLPLIISTVLARRPVPAYARARQLAELGVFVVTGLLGTLIGGSGGALVAALGIIPLVALTAAVRRCARLAATDNSAELATAAASAQRLLWPTRMTPTIASFQLQAAASNGSLATMLPRLDALVGTRRATPTLELQLARFGVGDEERALVTARTLLAAGVGVEEQAAASSFVAERDLPTALAWWLTPAAKVVRTRAPFSTLTSMLAAAGRVDEVRRIAPRLSNSALSKASFIAFAEVAGGATPEQAAAPLHAMGAPGRQAAERLIQRPPRQQHLTAAQHAQVDALVADTHHTLASFGSDTGAWRPYATWAIGAMLSVAFVIQLAAGGFSERHLYDMGAFVTGPGKVEWWRAATASVLHGSVGHFVFNAVGLLILGRIAEARMSRWVYLLTWTVSALGAFVVYGLVKADTVGLAVGASGGIMGLLGASVAVLVVLQRRSPSAVNRRSVSVLMVMTILQLLIDSIVPNVAQLGHAAGLCIGAAIGLTWALTHRTGPATAATSATASTP